MRSVSMRACCAALLLLLVLSSTVPAFAGRIHSPPGSPAEEVLPPEAEPPSVWEFLLVWLQTRVQPPVG
jgi:hypothetical protein